MASGYFHFGAEAAILINAGPLEIIIGNGQANKLITRITGQVSAVLYNNTDQQPHQFLFSINTLDTGVGTGSSAVQLTPSTVPVTTPPNQFTAEVDGSLLCVNGKGAGQQIGTSALYAPGAAIICPFDYCYAPPALARAGTLHAYLENRSFVNIEIHFTVQWQDP